MVKGVSCTLALITSYFAKRVQNPDLATVFELCCLLFNSAYLATGGDIVLFLAYSSHVSKRLKF